MRRSRVRRTPADRSGWRRCISSKIATARSPGAAFSIGTISLSKKSARGSGRRRLRVGSRCDGSLRSGSKRYAVAALIDALAAAIGGASVCRNFM
jgi:hypothetical protein